MEYIKYENFSEIHKDDEIKIIDNNNDWNGMHGIVERIIISNCDREYDVAVVFCIENPDRRYLVYNYNLDSVVRIER